MAIWLIKSSSWVGIHFIHHLSTKFTGIPLLKYLRFIEVLTLDSLLEFLTEQSHLAADLLIHPVHQALTSRIRIFIGINLIDKIEIFHSNKSMPM